MEKFTSITDLPRDAKNEKDLFGINKYEEGLVEFLRHTDTPMTIALQGEWGSGKTSLMDSLQYKLCKGGSFSNDGRYKGIWINTWEFALMADSSKVTLAVILAKILKQIVENGKVSQDTKEVVKKSLSAMLKFGASFVGGDASAITDLIDGDGGDKSDVSELRDCIEKIVAENISKGLYDGYIFFIDDLDRIQPSVAVELLEVMKNIFTIKNCIFVLAIDYDVVIKGLKPKFGELTDKNEREFRSFFDKIIQVPFSMPVSNYSTSDFIWSKLVELDYFKSDEESSYKENVGKVAEWTVGKNPRSIKRLLNTLSLIKCICNKGVEDGDVLDKGLNKFANFSLIAIQVIYPVLYRLLANTPDFTTWNDDILRKANLQAMPEEQKEKFKKNELFDDAWEQVIYQICQQDHFMQQRTYNISQLFNLIRSVVLSEKVTVDEIISNVISLSSVTNIAANDSSPIADFDKKSIINKIYKNIEPIWADSRKAFDGITFPNYKKNTGNGGLNMRIGNNVFHAIFSISNEKDGLVLKICNAEYRSEKKYFKSFDGLNHEQLKNEVNPILQKYFNKIDNIVQLNPNKYRADNREQFIITDGEKFHTFARDFFITVSSLEDFDSPEVCKTIVDVVMAGFAIHYAFENLKNK